MRSWKLTLSTKRAVPFPDLHVHRPSDEGDVGARACQHPAKVTADRASADDRDATRRSRSHAFSLLRPAAAEASAPEA
jgi:hypothetical protein